VWVTKGSLFAYSKIPSDELHFRLAFAVASEPELEEGVRLFANALRGICAGLLIKVYNYDRSLTEQAYENESTYSVLKYFLF
jgi:hypothetical protein